MRNVISLPLQILGKAPEFGVGDCQFGLAMRQIGFFLLYLYAPRMKVLNIIDPQQKSFVRPEFVPLITFALQLVP